MRFVRFSYYKTANRTALCGMVRCGAVLLTVQCGYAILQAVLVRFLRFVRFSYYKTVNRTAPCSVVQCGTLLLVVWLFLRSHVRCGLKFSQNHNRTAPHFCSHICGAVYKMWFE